jgi:ubiquinone biosynthesis monooxygenase Coq7
MTLSLLDKLIVGFDSSLRTLVPGATASDRASPADNQPEVDYSDRDRKHVAGLMRVNHTGEVCAQALYQGQALTAKLPDVKKEMEAAAAEERDHLVWCEQRLNQLNSRPSVLNPLFYGASFLMGAAAGKLGDRWSLGFVAATEQQVCKHLEDHLEQLSVEDTKTRSILEQMKTDEQRHGELAISSGGEVFPDVVQKGMTLMSKVMTKTTYYL